MGVFKNSEHFMRTRLGRAGNNWANWGLAGVRESFTSGWKRDLGFMKGADGKLSFLGGKAGMKGLMGLGAGVGVGSLVYAATDNPLLGAAAGVGATAAMGSLRAAGRTGMGLLGPAYIGASMIGGFKEGGLSGGLWEGAKSYGELRLWDVGFKAVSTAFKGSTLGGFAVTAALPLAITAGIGIGAYKGAQYLSERGRKAQRTEFAGDTTAFNTQAAYTMRQRALQEITRSHTNSRTILGQEAQLMHL
jgi:hypothetical protein